jgi:hypothetical protein
MRRLRPLLQVEGDRPEGRAVGEGARLKVEVHPGRDRAAAGDPDPIRQRGDRDLELGELTGQDLLFAPVSRLSRPCLPQGAFRARRLRGVRPQGVLRRGQAPPRLPAGAMRRAMRAPAACRRAASVACLPRRRLDNRGATQAWQGWRRPATHRRGGRPKRRAGASWLGFSRYTRSCSVSPIGVSVGTRVCRDLS